MDFSRQQTLSGDISKNRSSLTGDAVGKTGFLTGTFTVQQIGFEAEVPGKVVYHTGPKGDKGDPGKDGYTPVKGVDYFTPEEIEDVAERAAEIAAGNSIKADLKTDETLHFDENGVLGVNTTDEAEADNTLPITSAGVHTQLGNIEILLGTI